MSAEKIKVLAWGDYCCTTGFATVMSNIMMELHKTGKYDIDVIGINYSGDPYDPERFPGRVFPAMPGIMAGGPYADVYGRQRLLDMISKGEYDVLFMVQDHFILQTMVGPLLNTQQDLAKHKKKGAPVKVFKSVFYHPVDGTLKPEWATDVIDKMDYPVAYTNYGRAQVAKYVPERADMPVIYHGTNLTDFFPIDTTDPKNVEQLKDFRHKFFSGLADDRFLIVNVNRNQPRKDTVRNLMVLKELKDRGLNPLLYLHMQHDDAGGNVLVMAEQLGLENGKDFCMPHPNVFNANVGMPIENINLIYNAADLVFTPTLGEGWGLSITEAMATGTPVVAPNHTSLTEMLADNRGVLIPAGDTPTNWIMKEGDNERIRPLMNVTAAADAIEGIIKGNVAPDISAALEWVRSLSWENITKEWVKIIDAAAQASRSEFVVVPNRAARRAAKKVKR